MTLYTLLFYIIAALILVSTAVAITRSNIVHAVIYLVLSFFGTAMLFYLLGAPLLAALEIIIYAGAIMILFLFIIMMLKVETLEEQLFPFEQWVPAAGLSLVYLVVGGMLVWNDPASKVPLNGAVAEPLRFGRYLFERHWLAIELASLLLLIALVGALYIGRADKHRSTARLREKP